VAYNGPEYRAYVKEQRALIREISEETGQLPTRIARLETDVKNPSRTTMFWPWTLMAISTR